MPDQPQHRSRDELLAALPHIAAAPKDDGRLELIVIRPDHGRRHAVERAAITAKRGIDGDHWSKGCWLTTKDGDPHPDVQISLMSARAISAIAGSPRNWPAAGNNLYVDMDVSPENLPAWTRLALGTAVIEITEEPNTGCAAFIERYGRDACVFVNTGPGRALRARGLFARVVKDGEIRVGDSVKKL